MSIINKIIVNEVDHSVGKCGTFEVGYKSLLSDCDSFNDQRGLEKKVKRHNNQDDQRKYFAY